MRYRALGFAGGLVAVLPLIAGPLLAQETRIASDFEIATARKQLERERDPLLKMAAHLNLGDLYLSRRDVSVAQTHYRGARVLAETARLNARRRSDLSSYATASGYLGLASAKLGRAAEAFDAFEEAIRYASDSARLWNLYATAMSLVEHPHKAIAAGRRAVAIVSAAAGDAPSAAILLDQAVYRHALASALLSVQQSEATAEAERLLLQIVETLESTAFERIREQIAQQEKFEVFSTTRGDADSYLALMNRGHLRLARLYEERGEAARAIAQLEKVLELRTDDPMALTALARLSRGPEQRDRYFASAFDANPFSIALIHEYEKFLQPQTPSPPAGTAPGRLVQRAVHAYATGNVRQSADLLRELSTRYPDNDVVRFLQARNELLLGGADAARNTAETLRRSPQLRQELLELIAESETASQPPAFLTRPETRRGALRAPGGARRAPLQGTASVIEPSAEDLQRLAGSIRLNRLSPEQRARLDSMVFSSLVRFDRPSSSSDSTTTFSSGRIETVRFRFQQPTEFRGAFASNQPLRLDYRVLGMTEQDGETALLLEPLRIASP
jgi:tetratricopeptide (TPR) repeat protein